MLGLCELTSCRRQALPAVLIDIETALAVEVTAALLQVRLDAVLEDLQDRGRHVRLVRIVDPKGHRDPEIRGHRSAGEEC